MDHLRWVLGYTAFHEPTMAVVESATPSECKNNYELQIKQIREITGANNNEAWDAFKEGSFDILKAIQILRVQTENEELDKQQPRNESSANKTTPKDQNNVIDLTGEKDKDEQDIEKAIALSLQDAKSKDLLNEQRDISRALEASFKDSKPGSKRTRNSDFWQSVVEANPHEKRRCKCYPVGLKNVGNTCWFSAVVQSLFHIPAFRRNILDFSRAYENNDKDDRKIMIVKELQKLFAFMMGSQKKYIDPSNVIQCLTDFFKEDFNQQDVSEFMIKLIDCLEGTFSTNCLTDEDSKPLNPVVEMFYGQYTVEGMSAGKHYTKEETFGAYPLQIENYGNLHECIEGAMVQNNIEFADDQADGNVYTQELWFTRLPAVLILQLSRFRFNQYSQQPEKIHNKLEFEESMYMDCYMQDNRDTVRVMRKEISKFTAKTTVEESADELPATGMKCNLSEDHVDPMDISDSEESPAVGKPSLHSLFASNGFPRKVHYKLHAVLVHEGEANGGHYWSFIYDAHDKLWRKYNDITVSDVTWEDVCRGSVGGSLSSSAYCLIYTESKKSSELFNDKDCCITEKLRTLVEEDNTKFEEELREWDRKEMSTVKEEKSSGTPNDTLAANMEMENQIPQGIQEYSPQKKNHRLNDSSKILNDVTNMVSKALDKNNLGNALLDWRDKKREELKNRVAKGSSSAQQCHSDVRLEHKAIYMMTCHAPDHVINRAIVETFLKETTSKPGENETHGICREARDFLQKEHDIGEPDEYKTWTDRHSTFLKANLSFLNGVDHFCDNKYHEALPYLTLAAKLNSSLPHDGLLNKEIIDLTIGLCLSGISEKVFPMFTTGCDEEVCEALRVMTQQVIPYMKISDCCTTIERIRDTWLMPCLEKPREGTASSFLSSIGDSNVKKTKPRQSGLNSSFNLYAVQPRSQAVLGAPRKLRSYLLIDQRGKRQHLIENFLHDLFEGNTTNPLPDPPLLTCELDCKTLSRKYSKIMKIFYNSSHM